MISIKVYYFDILKSFIRRRVIAIIALALSCFFTASLSMSWAQEQPYANTNVFLTQLWKDAHKLGIRRETFDEALAGFTPDPKIIKHTHQQSEFVRPIWDYLDNALAKSRLKRGRTVAQNWQQTLQKIEKRYGVPRSAILGVWGMESNFGSFSGKTSTIRALATLAFERYRGDFFYNQLLDALIMVQSDHLDPAMMVGSWAGAMGQVQFMPSSYRKFAVDFDNDGIKNIWSSEPDSLASVANYLSQHGWDKSLPWGFEVHLPNKFNFQNYEHDFSTWINLGIARADGKPMPKKGQARIFAPAGARGPIFLLTNNFNVIKAYNSSDAYALGVLLLGDRLIGLSPVTTLWPRSEPQMGHNERVELQKILYQQGFYNESFDGKHGTKTREAVRQFQLRAGLVADGYPNYSVLEALRKAKK